MYYENRKRAQTHNYEPTKTDQAAARECDINVIVRNARIHGQAPGPTKQPQFADFSELPDNLQDFLAMGARAAQARGELPEALQAMSNEELLQATPTELAQRLQAHETIKERRAKLPTHLQSLPASSILALTEEQIQAIIRPPAQQSEPPKEPK